MKLTEFLSHFERVKQTGPGKYLVSCPCSSHGKGQGDRHPSLSVSQDHDRILINCFAGCSAEDILSSVGLTMKDLYDEPSKISSSGLPNSTVYAYRDADGKVEGKKVRGPGKKFYWDRAGKSKTEELPCVYHLPELLAAKSDDFIWIAEGEKDADRLMSLGEVAVSFPMGSGSRVDTLRADADAWDSLKGKKVVLCGDADEAGEKYNSKLKSLLRGHCSVYTLNFRTLLKEEVFLGFDVSDFLDRYPKGISLVKDRCEQISNRQKSRAIGEKRKRHEAQKQEFQERQTLEESLKSLMEDLGVTESKYPNLFSYWLSYGWAAYEALHPQSDARGRMKDMSRNSKKLVRAYRAFESSMKSGIPETFEMTDLLLKTSVLEGDIPPKIELWDAVDALKKYYSAMFAYGTVWLYDKKTGIYKPFKEKELEKLFSVLVKPLGWMENRSQSRYFAQHLTSEAVWLDNDPVHECIQTEKRYVTFLNGTYDAVEKKLLPFSPDYLQRRRCPYELDLDLLNDDSLFEEAFSKSRWKKFLCDQFDDPESLIALSQMFGLALLPSQREAGVCAILYGPGGNGKTIVTEVLCACFENSDQVLGSIGWDDMDHDFSVASLSGKGLNVSKDTKIKNLTGDTPRFFKSIVGGDSAAKINQKHQAVRQETLNCFTVMTMNELPRLAEKTFAMDRRFLLFHMPKTFGTAEEVKQGRAQYLKDPSLQDSIIKDELSLILVWALRGYQRLKANEFAFETSAELSQTKAEYRIYNSSFEEFLDSFATFGVSEKVFLPDLTRAYGDWMMIAYPSRKCQDPVTLKVQLEQLSVSVKKTSIAGQKGTVCVGVSIDRWKAFERLAGLNDAEKYKDFKRGLVKIDFESIFKKLDEADDFLQDPDFMMVEDE